MLEGGYDDLIDVFIEVNKFCLEVKGVWYQGS